MIEFDARYFNNAHRISDVPLKSTVTELYDGQWMMLEDAGTAVIHDGSANKRGYITISSKYGNPMNNIGNPVTAAKVGRDTVTSTGRVTLLIGPYRLATDQYETGTYHAGAALKISSNGKLQPFVVDTDKDVDIVAYVFAPPATVGAPMTIVHE